MPHNSMRHRNAAVRGPHNQDTREELIDGLEQLIQPSKRAFHKMLLPEMQSAQVVVHLGTLSKRTCRTCLSDYFP